MKFRVIIYEKRKPSEELKVKKSFTTDKFKTIMDCYEHYSEEHIENQVSVEDITDRNKGKHDATQTN